MNDVNENMVENDIKELNDSNDEEMNVNDNINNEYNEVYEPIEEEEDQNN